MTDGNQANDGDAQQDEMNEITVSIPVDRHRWAMYDEILDEIDAEQAEAIIATNLSGNAESIITEVYDNIDEIAGARQQIAANPEVDE